MKSRSRKKRRCRRTSINFPPEVMEQLEDLSALTHESLSSIVVEKVKNGLDLDEDAYWLRLVKERECKEYFSHEEAWKKKDTQ